MQNIPLRRALSACRLTTFVLLSPLSFTSSCQSAQPLTATPQALRSPPVKPYRGAAMSHACSLSAEPHRVHCTWNNQVSCSLLPLPLYSPSRPSVSPHRRSFVTSSPPSHSPPHVTAVHRVTTATVPPSSTFAFVHHRLVCRAFPFEQQPRHDNSHISTSCVDKPEDSSSSKSSRLTIPSPSRDCSAPNSLTHSVQHVHCYGYEFLFITLVPRSPPSVTLSAV